MRSPTMLSAQRLLAHIVVAAALALGLVIILPTIGGEINLKEALSGGPWSENPAPSSVIFWQTRLPRVLAALGCGAALAMAGAVYQAVLRNPLAEPYILGVSGGAALGKAIWAIIAVQSTLPLLGFSNIAAFLGAIVPVTLLHLLSTRRRRWNPETLLLAGVVMNVLASALLLLIQFFSDFTLVRQMFTWMLGGLDIVGYAPLAYLWPAVLIGGIILTWAGRHLNILTLGTTMAIHLGVEVKRTVTLCVWLATMLTAFSVAVAGPIGFVGLVVPHLVRALMGSDHRLLVPLSGLYGGIFLLACDFLGWRGMELLSRLNWASRNWGEIPAGIITACTGGLFFLYVLFRRETRGRDLEPHS
ncbi:MAG: iron ABC transporter permease [Candidatus Sumerlaeaceae bacterium]|nr:iron ABC transporter permease [Candidatus Sumerlaeaceae bacterium]